MHPESKMGSKGLLVLRHFSITLLLCCRVVGESGAASILREGSEIPKSAFSAAKGGESLFQPSLSRVDRFKEFLSSPPVIESFVFSERLPPDPKHPTRTDIPLTASKSFRYWHARWQPGAFFLRELQDPERLADGSTAGLLAAHYGQQCWFHFGNGYGDSYIAYGVSGPFETNHVCATAHLNSFVLRKVLNMGVMHAEIGSLKWTGNRFRVVTPIGAARISGELQTSATGAVDALRVKYTDKNGDIYWINRFTYDNLGEATGLPSIISCFWQNGDREVQRDEFRIIELRTVPSPIAPSEFRPDQFVVDNSWQVQHYSNGAVYAVLTNGETKLFDIRPPDFRLPTRVAGLPGRADFAFLYMLWGTANALIFVLLVRTIRKQKLATKMIQ